MVTSQICPRGQTITHDSPRLSTRQRAGLRRDKDLAYPQAFHPPQARLSRTRRGGALLQRRVPHHDHRLRRADDGADVLKGVRSLIPTTLAAALDTFYLEHL